MPVFSCELCDYKCYSRKSYVVHFRLHKNVHNIQFPCAFKSCNRRFTRYAAFRQHVLRDHAHSFKQPVISYRCKIELCAGLNFENSKLLFFHLKQHISQGLKIECPFLNCSSSFTNKSSFSSHLSRYHKHDGLPDQIKNVELENDILSSFETSNDDVHEEDGFENDSDSNIEKNENSENDQEIIKNLALFNLKLQAKHNVPNSLIENINQEIYQFSDLAVNSAVNVLKEKIAADPQSSVNEEVFEKVCHNELLQLTSSVLGTTYKRLNYYKKHFDYVAPVEIFLGKNELNKDCYMQYVPIHQTLIMLLKNKQIEEHFKMYSNEHSVADVLTDVKDGISFKRNILFQNNPGSIALLLFQDAFELVNPLGSARKKHSIIAVYFHLANFHPSYRSSVDNIQLALLCREKDLKYFGIDKIFERLIADITILEKEGIDVNGVKIKGTIFSILGDNLGSHTIGGFLENFNCEYFCRFCVTTKTNFKNIPFQIDELRSPDSYDSTLAALTTAEHQYGIKLKSPFNDLEYFHVCQPGLPPCLAHDLFEGVVPYDLYLYLRYFIEEKKWFNISYFNRRIASFPYKETDARNKPNPVNLQSKKITGHATQNWCLIRLLPLLIGQKVMDKSDLVWDLLLRLRNIVERICAPQISVEQVSFLQIQIEEYIELRAERFSTPLKPKHHFLIHYPYLITQFGPLIRLWTLRFESKHAYFKKCAKQSNNFRNICSTLAVHHQLLQAYIHEGNFFASKISTKSCVPFCGASFKQDIQNIIPSYLSSPNAVMTYDVLVQGVHYSKDLFLPLTNNLNGIVFGKILFMIINNTSDLYFIMEKLQSVYLEDMGVYHITCSSETTEFSCTNLKNILDYYPLVGYNRDKGLYICLHHSIVGL